MLKKIIATALVFALLSGLTACSGGGVSGAKKLPDGFNISQEKINERNILVSFEDADSIKNDETFDTIRIDAEMLYNGNVMQSASVETASKDMDASGIVLEVPYFGEYNVTETFLKDGKPVNTYGATVGVVADEYNIAPLIATTPVLIFSLKYLAGDIPQENENGPIPTIVTLARDAQYNWEALPDNMYQVPLLTENDKGETDFDALKVQMPIIKDYIEKLIELNSDSKFNYYMNDYHMYMVLTPLVYETNLPEDQYSLHFITDGSSSYNIFKNNYGGTDDAGAVHEQLMEEYVSLRDDLKTGKANDSWPAADDVNRYIYAMLDVEKDAEWWVIRKSGGDTFLIDDENFLQRVLDDERISNNYINGLLDEVHAADKDDELKALYKFEDEVFDRAEADGKKTMMILGTSALMEEEYPIEEYVKITEAYYGDDYTYIYKGHPGNIPDEARIKELEELGLEIVDASIAAELFMFYHPDVKLSGYPSTTFQSAPYDDTDLAMYLVNKERAYNSEEEMWAPVKDYASDMEFFISDVDKVISEDLGDISISQDILDSIPDNGHHFYLLEFNDGQPYDIGLWDVDEQALTLY